MSDDYDLALTGLVTTLVAGMSDCIRRYNDSSNRYYDAVDKYYELQYRNAADERRHAENLARIKAEEKLREKEVALKEKLLEAAERSYGRKMDYYQMLAKNAQEYFVPMKEELLALIRQTEFSCGQSSSGKEYDASVVRLEGLRESLDRCNKDYKELQFSLELAVSNAKLELSHTNQQRMMIER